ncbi:hypothetical protein [Bosea sp. TND4EK4]|uniref:hypothetical protein n=1 Tax=Bosea sp. TND4EK4 TaxID=1907408 RepID=UPI0009713026|nr:hypothetical protein [Bosea sp. TND4EK4]
MVIVDLESLPAFDRRLTALLQAVLAMESEGVPAAEIDACIKRGYARLVHTGPLSNLHENFKAALERARDQIGQNGQERACQDGASKQGGTHSISSRSSAR